MHSISSNEVTSSNDKILSICIRYLDEFQNIREVFIGFLNLERITGEDIGEVVFFVVVFFSIRIFFHRHWRLTGQQGKGGDHLLFHSITSTRLRTFRNLFATLHVRWLSHIFNCTPCIYQAATWWHLPPYWISIWLTDDMTLNFVCLRDDLILTFFCYSNLRWETGGFEVASTITLVLQAIRLTKCASHAILKFYRELGLDVKECKGQCYDGAANMQSKKKGVASVILREGLNSIVTHCSSHNLNLSLAASCNLL